MIILSICIPTYNFGKFIGQTLDSLIPELRDEVEVLILDAGSEDETSEVVLEKINKHSQIYFFDQKYRGGIDRDIETLVGLARGVYCWLLSADDLLIPGSIDKVLKLIISNNDLYLCENLLCNIDLDIQSNNPIFDEIKSPYLFDLSNKKERLIYFKNAKTTEAFFSFLSGPIFKKSLWNRGDKIPSSFYGTCWILAGKFLSLIPHGLNVCYVGEPFIYKRGENDSFSDKGIVNRLRISVEGFNHIAQFIFGINSLEVWHINRVVRNEWPLSRLLWVKSLVDKKDIGNIEMLNYVVKQYYSNAFPGKNLSYSVFKYTPTSFVKFLLLIKARSVKKLIQKLMQ
jgi:abequosyltransferase